jgi:hypothetical protein
LDESNPVNWPPKFMPDFFQTGAVTTLHRLGILDTPRLERDIEEFSTGA